MSTFYKVLKCKYISFVRDLKYINKEYLQNEIYLGFDFDNSLKTIEDIRNVNDGFSLIINAESNLFSDIVFEIDEEKIGESSKTEKKTQDVCKDVLLGGGQQLEAFSNNHFTIIPGKRNAGIQNVHPKQNHENIDSIARNGLMVVPKTSTQFSIGKLFNILSTKNNFNLIIVHKYLEVSIRESNYPGDYLEPPYIVGKGEILTVFYRYICIYLFGYMAVFNEENRDRNYDI